MYGYEIFHKEIMTTLINGVRSGTNANTYIFEGPKGLNKSQAARLFAKALVCNNPTDAPCCNCSSCTESQALSHPDIIFVEPENDKQTIGVNPIRDMIAESLIKPFYNHHKVFIIEKGDLLTPQAQNTFLKIIEEPPEYAVFIILCTNSEILLETVRSRAVLISFSPVSDLIVEDYIKTNYPDEARIDFLVKYCAGIPKYADEIINRENFETIREEVLNLIPRLLSKNKIHSYDVSDYFEKNRDNAAEIYDIMLMYLRDTLIYQMGNTENIVNSDKEEKISILAAKYTSQAIANAIDEIINSKKMLERYVKASATALHAALSIK